MKTHPFLLEPPSFPHGFAALDWYSRSVIRENGWKDRDLTEMGNCLEKFKHQGERAMVSEIAEAASQFIVDAWHIDSQIDVIVPFPPSNSDRFYQPVYLLAEQIGKLIGKPVAFDAIYKKTATSEVKKMDNEKRAEVLNLSLVASEKYIKNKTVLLLDDITQTGSTFRVGARKVLNEGRAADVYGLAMAKAGVHK
ncbi:MAG: ComF family protein [Fibrobacteres bacterium]|nr:ComF family protein [Fibrobacterota bacterium]